MQMIRWDLNMDQDILLFVKRPQEIQQIFTFQNLTPEKLNGFRLNINIAADNNLHVCYQHGVLVRNALTLQVNSAIKYVSANIWGEMKTTQWQRISLYLISTG